MSTIAAQAPGEWKAPGRAVRKKSPFPASAKSIAAGKVMFQVCAVCHGATGKGNGPAAAGLTPKPRNLTAPQITAQKDGELFWKIKTGRAPMPAFGTVYTPDQIWNLVHYVRSLSPDTSNAPPNTRPVIAVPVTDPRATTTRLLKRYLRVHELLSVRKPHREEVGLLVRDVSGFGSLAGPSFDPATRSTWTSAREKVVAGARRLERAKSVATRSEAFDSLSRAIDRMVNRFGHGHAQAVSVWMARGRGPDGTRLWLQTGTVPRNPYADARSAARGKLVRTYPASVGEPPPSSSTRMNVETRVPNVRTNGGRP